MHGRVCGWGATIQCVLLLRVYLGCAGSTPMQYSYLCYRATSERSCSPYSDCKVNLLLVCMSMYICEAYAYTFAASAVFLRTAFVRLPLPLALQVGTHQSLLAS